MWSSKPEDSLGMIDLGRTYERARLNENPIFLRCLFVLLGLIQATRHLAVDYDQIAIPTWIDDAASQKPEQASSGSNASASLLSKLPPTLQLLAGRSTGIAHRALKLTVVGILFVTLPVYFLVLRRTVWSWTYMVGRAFYGQLPPSAPPTGLLNFGRLAWQAFFGAFLLALLWEFSNATFAVYVAQPPLKKGQPLTNEIKDVRGVLLHRSKDPNGSLITGLKSKREVPRTFAFWELYIICTQFEVRRKTIFIEVDRSGGSTWRQVCDQCLAEISKISQRINSVDDYGRRIVSAPKPQELAGDANAASIGLPKIANHGIQDRPDMFLKPKKDLAQAVGTFAKSIGQSPTSHNPVASIQRSAEQILPKEQRQRIVQDQFAQANSYAVKFLQMPVGEAFRQTFAYRASAVTFGTPHSNRVTVIYAVRALTKLAVCSLTEAQYGGVSKDIPVIIRTLTAAIRSMERFTRTLKPDWTDVLFSERDREVADIRQVLEVIKAGLEEIVLAFGEYAGELGLSKMEVREARDASTRKAITSGGVAGAAETKRLPSNSGERVEMVQRRRG
jgi:nucleoporin NDC1